MERPCPFWADERECSSKECGIEHCDDEVPAALRNPAVQMVRFVSEVANNSTNPKSNKTREVVLTSSKLHSPSDASHLSTACVSPHSPPNTHSTCTSFKQAQSKGDQTTADDPKCNSGNQFDPIDTSLSEGDKAQLEDMEYFEDSSDRFCDFEGN